MSKFLLPLAVATVIVAPAATAQTNPDLAAVQRHLSGVVSMTACLLYTSPSPRD